MRFLNSSTFSGILPISDVTTERSDSIQRIVEVQGRDVKAGSDAANCSLLTD